MRITNPPAKWKTPIGQVIVWNILQKLGQKEEYRTEEFRKSVYETVERIIKQLVRIKIYYEREEA